MRYTASFSQDADIRLSIRFANLLVFKVNKF
jgi:hypothetical protein